MSGCRSPPLVRPRGQGQLTEGREVPGAERGNLVAVCIAAAAQEPSWGSCKGLGRWAEAEAGAQAGEAGTEERISYTRGHAARTATTCHSWPPFRGHSILPTDRQGGGPGRSGVGTSRREKGGGTWGPGTRGSSLFPGLGLNRIGEGLEEEGLSGRLKSRIMPRLGPGSAHLHLIRPGVPEAQA